MLAEPATHALAYVFAVFSFTGGADSALDESDPGLGSSNTRALPAIGIPKLVAGANLVNQQQILQPVRVIGIRRPRMRR